EVVPASCAARASHDQTALAELRDRLVLVCRAAVRLHMGDLERDPIGSERPVNERQRSRVGAIGAVHSPNRRTANREFVDVGLARIGSPATAIVVRVLACNCRRDRQDGNQHHLVFHERLPQENTLRKFSSLERIHGNDRKLSSSRPPHKEDRKWNLRNLNSRSRLSKPSSAGAFLESAVSSSN